MEFTAPRRHLRWGSIIFMLGIHSAVLFGLPVYVYYHGITFPEMALFIFYTLATSFAITVGYHRLFAHSTFKTNPFWTFLMLFFGAATFEQSALKWSSQHRRHHQFTDTEKDPYNIKKGFFYAHMGWIMFWKHSVNYDNVKDLQKSRLIAHQHANYQWWSMIAGVVTPLAIGGLTDNMLGALLWSVAARIVLVFHSAFFINSFAHTFGTRPYDPTISAKDNWFGAVLTNGEGYHNFHHKFPNDYRNGIRWYHWDPSKWFIWVLARLGFAWDLKRTSDHQIFQARLAASRKSETPAPELARV
jgi:stearoyl-CoA desaturase (delta-9 desaturase)